MSNKRLQIQQTKLIDSGYEVIKQDAWIIWIKGPQSSPFQGGQFAIQFKLDNFPFKAPVITFKTKIFHPNIDKSGAICSDMLQIGKDWAPTKNLLTILEKIMSSLTLPSLQNAMNPEAAQAYKNGTWAGRARQQTMKYAKNNK